MVKNLTGGEGRRVAPRVGELWNRESMVFTYQGERTS